MIVFGGILWFFCLFKVIFILKSPDFYPKILGMILLTIYGGAWVLGTILYTIYFVTGKMS
jgi:hypothetical protein